MADTSNLESTLNCNLCDFFGQSSESSSSKMVTIKTKALDSMKKISKERKDGFEKTLHDADFIHVHKNCRLNYYSPRHSQTAKRKAKEEKEKNISPVKKLRSASQRISDDDSLSDSATISEDLSPNVIKVETDFSIICFICNKKINTKKGKDKFSTLTSNGKDSIMKIVQDRATELQKTVFRTVCSYDLVACNAKYHRKCFMDLQHQSRDNYEAEKTEEIDESIKTLSKFLEENYDQQFRLTDLMKHLEKNKYQISKPTILSKFKVHFGEKLFITSLSGSDTLLCLTDTAFEVMSSSYDQKSDSDCHNKEPILFAAEGEEKKTILDEAIAVVMNDVWKVSCDKTTYLPSNKMFDDVNKDIPESLRYLLGGLIRPKRLGGENQDMEPYERVRTCVAHTIMATNLPKNFKSSLQLAVAV